MQVTTFKCYITKCTKLTRGEYAEVVPVHDIKAYTALLILELNTRWSGQFQAPATLPPVSTEWEVE